MSSKAPINDLNEIAQRKQELRAKIELQERKLSRDIDAYQDDIEMFKNTWNGFKSVRNFGKNLSSSGVGQVLKTVHALPFGKTAKKASSKPGWLTALSIGTELVSWIILRRKKKGKA
jgi:hypothetical protein